MEDKCIKCGNTAPLIKLPEPLRGYICHRCRAILFIELQAMKQKREEDADTNR